MDNNPDKTKRLGYLKEELRKQLQELDIHNEHTAKLKESINFQQQEIRYNKGWREFHENSIENHKKQIQQTLNLDEKKDQEIKLAFHVRQIQEHHNKYLEYHKRQIEYSGDWLCLHKKGIIECNKQIEFLKQKIQENTT